jgi:hypothetical protein
MDRESRARAITKLCDKSGCAESKRKLHFEQFVDRSFNPHPPNAFIQWWYRHPDARSEGPEDMRGPDAVRAYNCVRYRNEYLDAKELGIVT